MAGLTRRDVLKNSALGSAALLTRGAAFGAPIAELSESRSSGPFPGGVAASVEAGAERAVEDSATLEEHFDRSSIASKPAYTILADANGAPRSLHNAAIIEGRDGVLIAAWSNKGAHGDNDSSDFIESSTSSDRGRTWTEPVMACSPSAINATLLRARNGDAVLFYNQNHSTRQDDAGIAFRRTPDNGRTWSEPRPVDIGAPVAIIVQNGLVLPNGNWLISFSYDRSGQTGPFSVSKVDYVAAVALSSDEGKSWHRHGAIAVPNEQRSPNTTSWAAEPAVCQLQNGVLRMIIRTRAERLYESISRDQGLTWTDASPLNFSSDDSKPAVLALPDNHVALFWNDTSVVDFTRRTPLMATLSSDGGETWFRSVTLEDDNVTLDYPTAIRAEDAILVVYSYNTQQIRMLRLEEKDFCHWTPINKTGAWQVKDGVLQFAGGTEPQNSLDWLHWSKAVAFLPARPSDFSLEVDLRVDGNLTNDAVLGVFPAYQDESNWTGWLWNPVQGKAGLQQESHWGSLNRPAYACNRSDFYLEAALHADQNHWYRLHLEVEPGRIDYRLTDRDSGGVLFAGSNKVVWEGRFLALGGRQLAASFDRVVVGSHSKQKADSI
jgi:predicted neuraminidase